MRQRHQDKTRAAHARAPQTETNSFFHVIEWRAINLIALGETRAQKITNCVGEECANERWRQSFILWRGGDVERFERTNAHQPPKSDFKQQAERACFSRSAAAIRRRKFTIQFKKLLPPAA